MSWPDLIAVAGGGLAGFISGAIGIGGGLVFVPVMTLGLRVSQHVAQGTSLVAIIPTALVGGLTHLRQGNVLREAALWMGGGGVAGSVIGAFVAVELPAQWLSRAFGVFLLFSAYRMFVQARASRRTPPG